MIIRKKASFFGREAPGSFVPGLHCRAIEPYSPSLLGEQKK
jgi:hypothetical protein